MCVRANGWSRRYGSLEMLIITIIIAITQAPTSDFLTSIALSVFITYIIHHYQTHSRAQAYTHEHLHKTRTPVVK